MTFLTFGAAIGYLNYSVPGICYGIISAYIGQTIAGIIIAFVNGK